VFYIILHSFLSFDDTQVAQSNSFRTGMFLVAIGVLDGAATEVRIVDPLGVAVTVLVEFNFRRRGPVKIGGEQGIVPLGSVDGNSDKGPPPDFGNPAGGDLRDRIGEAIVFEALVFVPVNVPGVEQDAVDLVETNNFTNVVEIGRPTPLHNIAANDNDFEGSLGIHKLGSNPLGLYWTETVSQFFVAVPVVVSDDKVDISPIKTVVDAITIAVTVTIVIVIVVVATQDTGSRPERPKGMEGLFLSHLIGIAP